MRYQTPLTKHALYDIILCLGPNANAYNSSVALGYLHYFIDITCEEDNNNMIRNNCTL